MSAATVARTWCHARGCAARARPTTYQPDDERLDPRAIDPEACPYGEIARFFASSQLERLRLQH
jgi:hypothetical protein